VTSDKYYENYFDLFVHLGWKQYVEEAEDSLKSLNLEHCKDWDSFLVMKTKIGLLKSIVQFEYLIGQSQKLIADNTNTDESTGTNDSI